MTPTLLSFVDQAATVLWVAGVQFAVFGLALAVPLWLWRRRAVVRHHLAVAAIIGALLSPLTAIASLRIDVDWIPVPAWILPQTVPTNIAAVETPVPPIERTAPRTDAVNPTGAATHDATDPPIPAVPASPAVTPPSKVTTNARDGKPRAEPTHVVKPAPAAESVPVAVDLSGPQRTSERISETTISHALRASSEPSRFFVVLRGGLIVWLSGMLILIVRMLRLRRQVGTLVSTATSTAEPRLAAIARQTTIETGLSAPLAVLVSGVVTNPFVTGLFQPRIVVPASLLEPSKEASLRHVLLHEFCHVARGDLWIAAFVQVARTLFWPHPIVHFYAAVISRTREELCDDRVLESVAATDYSRTLLTLSERSSKALPATLALFPRRESLSARIARLLDPRRDRSLRMGRRQRLLAAIVVAVAATAAVGIGTSGASDGSKDAGNQPVVKDELDTDSFVRDLASRSAFWLAPSPQLKQLEYDYALGTDVTPVNIKRGDRRPRGVWFGATLSTAFHQVVRSPERFDITTKRADDGKTIILVAKPKEGNISISAGNGIEGSWRGYFSQGARETTIVIDAERLVPLEEHTGSTTFRFSEWDEVADGKWIPRQIDMIGHGMRWRMQFVWLDHAAWLLKSSESITAEATTTVARTKNVRVNGKAVVVPETEAQRRSREAAKTLLAMLDHNRPWLDAGETGAGWKPPFETLSYTFHTLREDVRETCVLTRDGVAVVEVTSDVPGNIGRRKVTLETPHTVTSRRGDHFASISDRRDQDYVQPPDIALKRYARIGCQFDLPLFGFHDRLDQATVTVEDGQWNGKPCRVTTVTNLGSIVPLGYGTMLAFTSWSYVHHIAPSQEVLYIDPERNVVLHETLTSSRDGKTFEVDFGDYVEVEPGQWAPLSIRIEAKDYFTSEYRFQLLEKKHWMLKEVVSWYDPDNKSRGVVENVQIDGDRTLLDEALEQVEATQALFSGTGEPDGTADVAIIPFKLGQPIDVGPYELKISTASVWSVVVSASTDDPNASAVVPLVFLDEKHRPLFAPTISLVEKDGVRQGSAELGGSSVWKQVTSIAVPVAGQKPVPVTVVPLERGKPLAVNIPGVKYGETFHWKGDPFPDKAKTRVYRVQADWTDERSATVALDVVSIDRLKEFRLDLSAAMLDKSGKLLATGHHSGTIRVESDPAEQHVTIDLGKLPAHVEPAYLAIGVAPGDTVSALSGSMWATFFDTYPPFEIATLLAASDNNTRRVGLVSLDENHIDRALQEEFFEERGGDEDWIGNGKYSRKTLLRPHVESLFRIVQDSGAADVQAAAAIFLAYSEADNVVAHLKPLLDSESPVREAAAIGLTFLGETGHLDVLRDVLVAKQVSLDDGVGRSVWKAVRNRERDTLVALTHQGSDAAVDLLGETLLSDLNGAHLATGEGSRMRLEGRTYRAKQIVTLLGRTKNPRSVLWLTKAAELIDRRDDLDEHFGVEEIARSMLRFKEQAREAILTGITTGDNVGSWLYVIKESRDAGFLPAVRKRLERGDVTAWELRSAVLYFWNLREPASLDALREVYERGKHKDDRRAWLTLCEALAVKGDGRGLMDAYAVLVDLQRPAAPPADEEELDDWQDARDDARDYAEAVFERATPDMIAEFLHGKADVESVEEQRVVLSLLWKLSELPEPFTTVLSRWSKSTDSEIAKSASRLLGRE